MTWPGLEPGLQWWEDADEPPELKQFKNVWYRCTTLHSKPNVILISGPRPGLNDKIWPFSKRFYNDLNWISQILVLITPIDTVIFNRPQIISIYNKGNLWSVMRIWEYLWNICAHFFLNLLYPTHKTIFLPVVLNGRKSQFLALKEITAYFWSLEAISNSDKMASNNKMVGEKRIGSIRSEIVVA
jgi:hypothetical protein